MCGGNIRLALEFVRSFVGSGHVNTEKILQIYRETGRYLVPLHEFERAVIYGDHEYYSSDASFILNLFDISTNDAKEHFLSPILLAQLHRWAQQSSNDGFVGVAEFLDYLQNLGFSPHQIWWHVERLLRGGLIETPIKERLQKERNLSNYYRITTVGAYYVKRLVAEFTYVDAMCVDTPVADPVLRQDITQAYTILDRLERAKAFRNYLDKQWNILNSQSLAFHWPFYSRLIDRNVEYIKGKINIREDEMPSPPPEFVENKEDSTGNESVSTSE
jgi:hypothetical protein